jgi:hypothetical protein
MSEAFWGSQLAGLGHNMLCPYGILMRKCEAFAPAVGNRWAWVGCGRKAAAGSRYCVEHRDALIGAMLGVVGRRGFAGSRFGHGELGGFEVSPRFLHYARSVLRSE